MPALLGALGLVAILFALASFVMALAGIVTLTWSIVHGVVGIVLLGSAAAVNLDALRERMSSGEARRAGRYGTSAVLSTVLAVAILGMGGFLANRYHHRFDWTEQGIHSLSDQTIKTLEGLEDKVEVVALYSRLDWAPVRELLDRYAYESPNFEIVEFADPNEKPDALERYDVAAEQVGRGLVRLSYQGEAVTVDELSEENLTNAIVKLSRGGGKKVYFLTGHNERAIDGEAAAEKDGYSRAADALRNENYTVEPLLLAAAGDVPEDADVVIVAGATRPLLAEETAALQAYLERGGAVLAMVDPRAQTDLVETLAGWGVALGNDIIVDRQLALFGRATTPFAGNYDPVHPITKDMRDTTLFHAARSVQPTEGTTGITEIVKTGDQSWAERDLERFFTEGSAELDDDDLRGPVPVGVAGEPSLEGETSGSPRLAVFGDSDFAANELITAYRNRDLYVNTVNWLVGDVEAISIRPNLSRASRFQLSQAQFQNIRLFALFVLPEALAVMGVFTWWSRRQPARS